MTLKDGEVYIGGHGTVGLSFTVGVEPAFRACT